MKPDPARKNANRPTEPTLTKGLLRTLSYSIGLKINILFSVVVVFVVAFSLYSRSMLDRYSASYNQQIAMHAAIMHLKSSFTRCGDSITAYIKTGNRIMLADFNHEFEAAEEGISELYDFAMDDEMLYLLRSVELSAETYFRECSAASFLFNTRNYEYNGKLYYAASILEYLQRYCDELTEQILVTGVAENRALDRRQNMLRLWSNTLNGILIAFLLGLFLYFTAAVTRPLGRLASQAREVSSGNFKARVRVRNPNNSMGILETTFNSMAESIETMMKEIRHNVETEKKLLEEQRKVVEYKELLNQATFMTLQTQTNPHFLFNTLSSISRTVTLGKKDQTLLMIDALAHLLRYSLTDAGSPALLSDELAATEEYVKIQTLRFADRISASFRIEEGLQDKVLLPRFTLQPLVENAIIHGLEPKEAGGKLLVSAIRRNDRALIRIFDNGCGIDPLQLRRIRGQTGNDMANHIGVGNTKKRLYLFTKEEKSFRISSRSGSGTLIAISIPLREESRV